MLSMPTMPSDSTESEESRPLLKPVHSSSVAGQRAGLGLHSSACSFYPFSSPFSSSCSSARLCSAVRLSLLQNYQVADIKEHCFIVTGASQGLGKQFAKILADEGVTKLGIAARSTDKLEQLTTEVTTAHPLCFVLVVPTDVTDAAPRDNLVQQSVLHAGTNKMTLISNAGFDAKQHLDLALSESSPEVRHANRPRPACCSAPEPSCSTRVHGTPGEEWRACGQHWLCRKQGSRTVSGASATATTHVSHPLRCSSTPHMSAPFQVAYNVTKIVGFTRCVTPLSLQPCWY